jgi:hypothetical protein
MKKTTYDKLNEHYREVIDVELTKRFGKLGFKTTWSLLEMNLVTTWSKKLSPKLTEEIKVYTAGYSNGYAEAMNFAGSQ